MQVTLQRKSMASEIKINKTDDNGENKRKRSETSSASELDNSTSSDAQDCKKGKKKKPKMASIKEKPVKESNPVSSTEVQNDNVAAQLKALNMKMANVMTKDDKSLKKMIKSLFHEMKEDFLQSVFHRIELLETSIYEKDQENDKLKKQINNLNAELESQKEEMITLRQETDKANEKVEGKLNALEQYGRRNSIRIDGINNINQDETPMMTSKLVVNKLNENIEGLNLKVSDIDIAHRVGKEKRPGKKQIIVKFVSRMTKDKLMYQKHQLKNTGIYVNEDLTATNAYVLACIRKKLPDEVDKAWSQNGRLWYKNKMGHKHTVEYKEYQHWKDLNWLDDATSVKSNNAAETNLEAGTSVHVPMD